MAQEVAFMDKDNDGSISEQEYIGDIYRVGFESKYFIYIDLT